MVITIMIFIKTQTSDKNMDVLQITNSSLEKEKKKLIQKTTYKKMKSSNDIHKQLQ